MAAGMEDKYGPLLATNLRFDALIEYQNADGDCTPRRVTVHHLHGRVIHSPPAFDLDYMRGLCHERSAVRTFRTDRIRSLADPLTGEVVPDCELWLCKQARLTEIAAAEYVARFTAATAMAVREARVNLLWQRAPGITESFIADIDEVHRRAGHIVGFRARALRIPSATASRWEGDKTFDLDLTDGDGVLALEFDSTLYEEADEIAAWLGGLRPLR